MMHLNKSLILIAIEGRNILGGSLKPKNDEQDDYMNKYRITARHGTKQGFGDTTNKLGKTKDMFNKSKEFSKSPERGSPKKTLQTKKIKE